MSSYSRSIRIFQIMGLLILLLFAVGSVAGFIWSLSDTSGFKYLAMFGSLLVMVGSIGYFIDVLCDFIEGIKDGG